MKYRGILPLRLHINVLKHNYGSEGWGFESLQAHKTSAGSHDMRRFSNWRVRRRNPPSRIALGGSLLTRAGFFNLRFIWTRTLSLRPPNGRPFGSRPLLTLSLRSRVSCRQKPTDVAFFAATPYPRAAELRFSMNLKVLVQLDMGLILTKT